MQATHLDHSNALLSWQRYIGFLAAFVKGCYLPATTCSPLAVHALLSDKTGKLYHAALSLGKFA